MRKKSNVIDSIVDLELRTDRVKLKVMQYLKEEQAERRKYAMKQRKRVLIIAALITIVCITSAFAVGGIISYFSNEKAIEITDVSELEKNNDSIGLSASRDGYTLKLDNLAIDENFLHVFYTISSDKMKIKDNKNIRPFIMCRIDGKLIAKDSDYKMHGYYEDEYTYKVVVKYDILHEEIPQRFVFEMYVSPSYEELLQFEKGYLSQEVLDLTNEDKNKLLYISYEAEKTTLESENKVYTPNQNFYININGNNIKGNVEKVVFSPFGNQIAVKYDVPVSKDSMNMAIKDEKGRFCDIISPDFINEENRSDDSFEKNSDTIEFITSNKNTKYLTLIPIKPEKEKEIKIRKKKSSYPMVYKINEYGSVVVTNILIEDGRINVNYYIDGYMHDLPEFIFIDKTGEKIILGKTPATIYETHYATNSYTVSYYYDDYNENGKMELPIDGSFDKERIEELFTELEVKGNIGYSLDYDNSINVKLK